MHAPSFEFTPGEAVYLANACLASAAVKRKEMGLRIALDRDAMVTRARSIAGREVTISTVNKAIEESIVKYRLVRSGRERRFLPGVAIVYIASFKLLDASFSRKAKRNFYRTLAEWMERPGKTGEGARETIRLSSYLVADLGDDLAEWSRLLDTYARNRSKLIEGNPDVMGGVPVVRGTRVTVHSIAAMVDGGDSAADIREEFPDLSEEAIEAAVVYARANPKPGRPKRFR